MWGLSLLFGGIIGISLGLTGGGGTIFAVPLLVYGLGMPTRDAVALSLAVVGMTACVGFFHRWLGGEIGLRTGAFFAISGMAGAPPGVWIASQLPESVLLLLFAGLMMTVSYQLWKHADDRPELPGAKAVITPVNRRIFQRDAAGRLLLTPKSIAALLALGFMTGMFSGLFGVGGGFVIVPTLVLITGMPIQRAIGTSLMVITLVSVSGVISHSAAGREVSLATAIPFGVGGITGLFTGQALGHRIAGPTLQRGFAVVILIVAVFVLIQNVVIHLPRNLVPPPEESLRSTPPSNRPLRLASTLTQDFPACPVSFRCCS